MVLGGSSTLQQLVGQYAPTGIRQPVSLHPSPPGTQNVPTIVPSASSATTLAPTVMPNLTASLLPGKQARDGRGAQGLPAAGFSHVEEGQPPAFSEKNLMKIPESLQLANNPSVNSLFGIPIQMDWDEDR